MTHTTNTLPPLPEPWDYCYEWNGPYGTRKFDGSLYNGRKPDAVVQLFTAEQVCKAQAEAHEAGRRAALAQSAQAPAQPTSADYLTFQPAPTSAVQAAPAQPAPSVEAIDRIMLLADRLAWAVEAEKEQAIRAALRSAVEALARSKQ